MKNRNFKLAYSKWLPFKNFYTFNLYGILIRREKYRNTPLRKTTHRHESFHEIQAEDFIPNKKNKLFNKILGYSIFYICYFIEFIIKYIIYLFLGGQIKPYRSISFEQEVYNNISDINYLDNRKRFNWTKYLFKLVWEQ